MIAPMTIDTVTRWPTCRCWPACERRDLERLARSFRERRFAEGQVITGERPGRGRVLRHRRGLGQRQCRRRAAHDARPGQRLRRDGADRPGPAIGDRRSPRPMCAAWRSPRGSSSPSSRSTRPSPGRCSRRWPSGFARWTRRSRAPRLTGAVAPALHDVQLGARRRPVRTARARTGSDRTGSEARARAARRARRRPGPAGSRGPRSRWRRRSPAGSAAAPTIALWSGLTS